jgi:hypothetical protein
MSVTAQQQQERRRPPVGIPWVLAFLLWVAGMVAHRVWGGTLPTTAVASVLLTVSSAGLVVLAWLYSHGREQLLRVHATVTTGFVGLSVLVTLIAGWHRPWADLYVGGAIVVCVSWNLRWIRALRGDGDDEHGGKDQTGWDEVLGLPGSKAKVKSVDGPRAEVAVKLGHGQTVRDLQRSLEPLTSHASMPIGGARAVGDPDHADKATLILVTKDMLKKTIDWPGPSNPGGSTRDPIPVGLYEDGSPVEVILPGNWEPKRPKGVKPRNALHLLIMGMSGAGKTQMALVVATELLTRRDVVLWWCDAVKGLQSARPIRSGIDWMVTNQSGAKAMLSAVQRVIRYRAERLGKDGYREWWPGCGLPYLVLWIEEASSVIPDSDTFVRLTEQARSVGCSIVVSQQRASHDNIPTSARANMGASMCFGVRDSADAGFALSDETLAAGAHPETWKADYLGYFYLEAPTVPSDRYSVPARGYHEEDNPLEQVVRACAGIRAELDEGSAEAAGKAYADRETAQEAEAAGATEPVIPTPREGPVGNNGSSSSDSDRYADVRDEDGDDDLDDLHDDPDDKWVVPTQPEPDMAGQVDPRAPLGGIDGDDFDLGDRVSDGKPTMTREQKEAAFTGMLQDLAEDGKTDVKMSELVDAWYLRTGQQPNQGRPFLHEMLGKLIDQGQVERDEDRGGGWYKLQMLVTK